MAAPQRIPQLWSTVYRASTDAQIPALRSARAAAYRAYHPSRRRWQDPVPQQRYGTANEPPPHLGGGKGIGPPTKATEQPPALPKIGDKLQQTREQEIKAEESKDEKQQDASSDSKRDPTTVDGKQSTPMADPMLDSSEARPVAEPPGAPSMPDRKPLASYLNGVGSPNDQQSKTNTEDAHAEEHPDKMFDEHSPPIKAPHIEQPRYVHHFDTYGLVKRLEEGKWHQDQAITIMKAVRLMLADNTDLAKEALVSKSQLENEAYLFKAACAELKTEVTARRKSEQEKMRTERTQLQHEVDILSQRLGQESAALKDDMKGMFDDRKMAVRNEQREMESKIQQLNYKITVDLQADAKSEIEGLRLVMTRRVILTLFIIVVMVIGGLKIASDAAKAANEEAGEGKRKKQTSMGDSGTQTEVLDDLGERRLQLSDGVVKEGEGGGFVSLG